MPGPRFKDQRGSDFQIRISRYYGSYPREVERVDLGCGTRLSGYTTMDPAEDKYTSLKSVLGIRTLSSCEEEVLGGDTNQQLNSGLKHGPGIRDHMGVRVSGTQEKEMNCINLKDKHRINFSLISWYR
jgi:hypothetical protein